MVFALAVSLIATLGATTAKEMVPAADKVENRTWLKPTVSDEFLAARLNVTNIPKTPIVR